MDSYDYNEDNLSTIARSCSYISGRNSLSSRHIGDISCNDCLHWNGNGCSRKHLDNIVSELHLD
jgi:hypothetical protein